MGVHSSLYCLLNSSLGGAGGKILYSSYIIKSYNHQIFVASLPSNSTRLQRCCRAKRECFRSGRLVHSSYFCLHYKVLSARAIYAKIIKFDITVKICVSEPRDFPCLFVEAMVRYSTV